jgi:hypothetical protein
VEGGGGKKPVPNKPGREHEELEYSQSFAGFESNEDRDWIESGFRSIEQDLHVSFSIQN